MAKYEKPDDTVNVVWAQDALSTDFYQPSDEEIRIGWEQEKPPYQVENWSMNKLHRMVAYLNQMGIPEWDRRTEYQENKSFVQASDGRLYRCIATNRDRNPAEGSNPDYWEHYKGDRSASNTREGVTRYATAAEVETGTRDDVAVTPYSLGQGRVGTPIGTIILWPGDTVPESYMECDGRYLSVYDFPELYAAVTRRYGYDGYNSRFKIPDLRGEFVRGWDHGRGIDSGRTLASNQSGSIESHSHSGYTNYEGNHSHSASTGSAGYHGHSGSTSTGGYHGHSGATNSAGNHRHGIYTASDDPDSGGNDRSSRGGIGAYTSYAGAHSHSVTVYGGGSHNHSLNINGNGSHTHSVSIGTNGNHRHSFTTNATGGGETRPRNVAMMYCIKYE